MSKLIGGPELRARLEALSGVGPDFVSQWADATMKKAAQTAPNPRREASHRWHSIIGHGPAGGARAAVYGAFWWIFVDRGTKAHEIEIRRKQALSDRKTIFGTKVHHRRIARRPFISLAAQEALAGSTFADSVVKAWNSRRIRGPHTSFL